MNRRLFLGTAAVIVLSAVAANAGARVAATPRHAVVRTAFNKKLKKTIVVDGAGRTLYMFTSDLNGKDTVCTPQGPYGAECPTIWPPLESAGAPRASGGIKASLLGVYTRRDGVRQVTYDRHPLFYFHGDASTPPGDKKPGDAHGQGFVGEWYVLAPDGTPIK